MDPWAYTLPAGMINELPWVVHWSMLSSLWNYWIKERITLCADSPANATFFPGQVFDPKPKIPPSFVILANVPALDINEAHLDGSKTSAESPKISGFRLIAIVRGLIRDPANSQYYCLANRGEIQTLPDCVACYSSLPRSHTSSISDISTHSYSLANEGVERITYLGCRHLIEEPILIKALQLFS